MAGLELWRECRVPRIVLANRAPHRFALIFRMALLLVLARFLPVVLHPYIQIQSRPTDRVAIEGGSDNFFHG